MNGQVLKGIKSGSKHRYYERNGRLALNLEMLDQSCYAFCMVSDKSCTTAPTIRSIVNENQEAGIDMEDRENREADFVMGDLIDEAEDETLNDINDDVIQEPSDLEDIMREDKMGDLEDDLEDADFMTSTDESMMTSTNQLYQDGWGCSIQVEAVNTLPCDEKAYVFDVPVQGNNETIHELTFGIPMGATGAPGNNGASVVLNVKRTVGLSPDEKAFVLDEQRTVNDITYHELTFGIPHACKEYDKSADTREALSSSIQQLDSMLPSLIEEWESNTFGTYSVSLYFTDGTSIDGGTFQSYSTGILKIKKADITHRINIRKISMIEVIPDMPIAGSTPKIMYNKEIKMLSDERAMKNGLSELTYHTFYTVTGLPITGIMTACVPGTFEVHVEDDQEFITTFDYIMYHGVNGISV